jgi:LacI family transcriptional regulator
MCRLMRRGIKPTKPSMDKTAAIKDIAARVGVGSTTVSVVLGATSSRHVRVSEATRARVLEAARAMNYRPNRAARSLRSRTTNVVGVCMTHGYLDPRVPFTLEIVGGLHQGCDENGKHLPLHGTYGGRAPQDVCAELTDGNIDGLVLSTTPQDPLVALLAASGLPVVAVADALPPLPSVVVDDTGGSRLLAAHLAASGHRRAAYFPSNSALTSASRRRLAFFEALRRGTAWRSPTGRASAGGTGAPRPPCAGTT